MMSINVLFAVSVLYGMCYAVIDSIELTKRIVTLCGLRWKTISKPTPAACESVEKRDVFKRLIFLLINANLTGYSS